MATGFNKIFLGQQPRQMAQEDFILLYMLHVLHFEFPCETFRHQTSEMFVTGEMS
jgi:hypothetical protein